MCASIPNRIEEINDPEFPRRCVLCQSDQWSEARLNDSKMHNHLEKNTGSANA